MIVFTRLRYAFKTASLVKVVEGLPLTQVDLGSNPGQGVLNLFFHTTQLLVSALLSLQLRIEGIRTEIYHLATSVSGYVS